MKKYFILLASLLIIPFMLNSTFESGSSVPKCDGITDDTAAIQSEINNKNATLPFGTCIITSTLYIGNGTNSTQSGSNDLSLTGQGFESGPDISNQWYSGGTRILWNGVTNGTMISVRGPIHDVTIQKINLDGNDKAGYGIYTVHMTGSYYNQVRVDRFTKSAFVFTVNATSSISGVAFGDCSNIFNQLSTSDPTNNKANGIILDGSPSLGLDTCQNQFNLSNIIYGGSSGSYGIKLNLADNNNFNGGLVLPSGSNTGGKGIYFVQQSNSYFPLENWFNGIAIKQGIGGNSGIGGNWFNPYPTSDGEPIPNLSNIHYCLYNATCH